MTTDTKVETWRFTVLDGTRAPNGGTILSMELHLGPSQIRARADECQMRMFDERAAGGTTPDFTLTSGNAFYWRDVVFDHFRDNIEEVVTRAQAEFDDLMLDATAYGFEKVVGRSIEVPVSTEGDVA